MTDRQGLAMWKNVIATLFGALWVAVIVGWVINLVEVVRVALSPDAPITALFVVKCIGVLVPPLGAVMGLFF